MTWTKAKTAIGIGAGLLLAAGTATVGVEQIIEHRTYPWQVRNLHSGMLDSLPPQVHIVPARFSQSGGSVSSDDKVMGLGYPLQAILLTAYQERSSSRIVYSTQLPEGKFDFIANLPQKSHEALQQELRRKFGLTASHQSFETNVLRLTVKNTAADGLRPSTSKNGSATSNPGQFSCVNQPLSCLISTLEDQLNIPIVDDTGLTGRFDIDITWDQTGFQGQPPDSLKQALLEDLGLELTAAKQPIDLLVVQLSR